MHHITNRNSASGYPKGYLPVIHKFVRNNPDKVCWHPLEARNVCIDVNHASEGNDDGNDAAARERKRKSEKKARKAAKRSKKDKDRASG